MRDPKLKVGQALVRIVSAVIALLCWSGAGHAYPEYQQFVETHSHRTVNCAMCHVHENGPTGNEKGQLNTLNEDQLKLLNKARTALAPGADVDSPILNEFGNSIIKAIGKKKFVQLRANPKELAKELGATSDLDGDGIPDSGEYLDGTDPLNKFHGDPGKLFLVNLERYKMHVVLAVVAILSLNYGLVHLIAGITKIQSARKKLN
ncbi:hypothetical protein KF913_05315 [Candidatus Obscuribacterales bacterium]|nr:hypothetical protein [Candidatus Obscuribacterales bacterium]